MTDICTQSSNSVQYIGASLPEYLIGRMAKESLCCVVPKTDFTRLPDGKDRVRCVFEKGEQFCFKHIPILERLLGPRRNVRNGI